MSKPKKAAAQPGASADQNDNVETAAAEYEPVGEVRVIAEGKHARILEDDVRRWKEPRE